MRATGSVDASMAQLVEQLIRNQQVAGSSPATSLEPVVFFFLNPKKARTASEKNGVSAPCLFFVTAYSVRSSRKFERTKPQLHNR